MHANFIHIIYYYYITFAKIISNVFDKISSAEMIAVTANILFIYPIY